MFRMSALATDLVAFNARRFPRLPALENAETGAMTSWLQLEDRVAHLAGGLAERFGVAKGDRVVMLADNDTRIFELQFACMRLGAIFVPLNWRLALPELVYQCGDSDARLVVHDATWADPARAMAADADVKQLLTWGTNDSPVDFDALIDQSGPWRAGRHNLFSDPTHILYTSGTTGRPKGAFTTFGTMAWHTLNILHVNLLGGPSCKLFNPLPLFHAGGLTTLAAPMHATGGCVTVARRFDPEQVLSFIGRPDSGVTHNGGVPTMYQMLVDSPSFANADFSGMRHTQIAGSSPSEDLVAALAERGIILQEQYGGTELGPNIASVPREAAGAKPGSCGFPVPYTQVRLVAPDGNDVAQGEVGEVWIAGPSVSPGYWRLDVETDGHHVDGWLMTGDAARQDEDGFLYIAGRYKDMYKSGGENVFAAEVEMVLIDHPDVFEAAVIGVPDARWDEVGRAYLVTRGGRQITTEELVAHCRGRLARYKIPKSAVIIETLPRNATGKVIKAELRAAAGAQD
jgi:fatty-acyl-CoA synthase